MGNLVIFALMSWLPCAALFAVTWLVGAGLESRGSSAGMGTPKAFGVLVGAVAAGCAVGVLLLAPGIAVPAVAAVVAAVLIGCALAAWYTPVRVRAAAAAAFVAGTHLPVLWGRAGDVPVQDGQDVFWVMPVLDLWLAVGLPVLVTVAAVTVVRLERAKAPVRAGSTHKSSNP